MHTIMIKRYLLAALFLLNSVVMFAQTKNFGIIYIGDSITAGAGLGDPAAQAPPVTASDWLRKQGNMHDIEFSNQGHSGFTTVDFLPGSEAFKQAEQAASTLAGKHYLLVFSIMLGTNDSAIEGTNGAPVAPERYSANLKSIIDRLLKDFPGCKVIIQHPIWYSPNTYNGARYLQEGLDRLQSYFPQIKALAESYQTAGKGRVFVGDTEAFGYFKANYLPNFQAENGHEGIFYLHPNQAGAVLLGNFWAKAIYKQIKGN